MKEHVNKGAQVLTNKTKISTTEDSKHLQVHICSKQ